MSEELISRQQVRLLRWAKTSRRNPPRLAGACCGDKFVVSRVGGAYDARGRGPNRKFRLNQGCSCLGRDVASFGKGGNVTLWRSTCELAAHH